MKKKSHSKTLRKINGLKQRNPFVFHLQNRPSGPQEKTNKAKRKAIKQKGFEE